MGLFFSNLNNPPKPPHEVLGLPPLFTKSQARSQYLKLIRLNPSLISNYNSAYNILKNEPPNLNLYNHEVLHDSVLVLDLFDRISDFSGFKCPEFRSPDFYKKFKNFNCPRKFKREEERNLFNFKIRKIIKEVYKIYEGGGDVREGDIGLRGSKVDIKDNSKDYKDIKDNINANDNHIIKLDKQFKCSYCSKGFRSKNQLINHLKSKKHFEKIKEKEKEPKRFIKKEIEGLVGGSEGDGNSKIR
ncbi:hypothetical protein evm_013976 [Chilo suppressalis]|nr:hypothetical protein evm_013976 [Chilo suppressalis]